MVVQVRGYAAAEVGKLMVITCILSVDSILYFFDFCLFSQPKCCKLPHKTVEKNHLKEVIFIKKSPTFI